MHWFYKHRRKQVKLTHHLKRRVPSCQKGGDSMRTQNRRMVPAEQQFEKRKPNPACKILERDHVAAASVQTWCCCSSNSTSTHCWDDCVPNTTRAVQRLRWVLFIPRCSSAPPLRVFKVRWPHPRQQTRLQHRTIRKRCPWPHQHRWERSRGRRSCGHPRGSFTTGGCTSGDELAGADGRECPHWNDPVPEAGPIPSADRKVRCLLECCSGVQHLSPTPFLQSGRF